jgi:predicted nuclease of predicted toxin-antitoxin system
MSISATRARIASDSGSLPDRTSGLFRAHRSAGAVDLLIAATAERERLTVLCDDHDYLTIATVTGQAVKLVGDS